MDKGPVLFSDYTVGGLPALLEVTVSKRETSRVERAGSPPVFYTLKET